MPVDGCFLCLTASGTADISWTDRPLWLDPRRGLLLPGLGGLTVGYVLLSPISHDPSLRASAMRPDDGRHFVEFVEEVLEFLGERLGGDLTYWEHGGADISEERQSACVEHAHLHIAAGHLPLSTPPGHVAHSGLGQALTWMAGSEDSNPYLLMGHTSGSCFTGRDAEPSQYYRREWAKIVGRDDEWDYLLSGSPDVTRRTIESILLPR
ncbi:hypothetical protein [Streptosporangium carneum]|uniref:Uncharacterized protein n=1 Tax=Streptosporangium carneum TaxID=47481 RepID=A0A9W6MI03_9ACTN|nr:hypothetical protein [Streptosporangium carneum]GLK14816.1 hypothetical protein GCM10017600_82280 [Streptosporangium carneum]